MSPAADHTARPVEASRDELKKPKAVLWQRQQMIASLVMTSDYVSWKVNWRLRRRKSSSRSRRFCSRGQKAHNKSDIKQQKSEIQKLSSESEQWRRRAEATTSATCHIYAHSLLTRQSAASLVSSSYSLFRFSISRQWPRIRHWQCQCHRSNGGSNRHPGLGKIRFHKQFSRPVLAGWHHRHPRMLLKLSISRMDVATPKAAAVALC